MLVSSCLNPSIPSTTHFVVVNYENDRVLVPTDTRAKYKDVVDFVRREWNLSDVPITLETNDLNICLGQWVRIHEEAWPGVKEVIGNVYVRLRNTTANGSKLTGSKTEVDYLYSEKVKAEETKDNESADESEVEQQVSAYVRNSGEPDEAQAQKPLPSPSRSASPAKGDTLNLFGEVSSIKKPKSKGRGLTEGVDDYDTTQMRSTKPNPSSLLSKQERPKNMIGTNSVAGSSDSTLPRSISPVKGKPDSPRNDLTADPERVCIAVQFPAGTGSEQRSFRIRREFTVFSVLKGIGKVMHFDHNHAVLYRVLKDPDMFYSDDEDDEGEPPSVKCERTDTMKSLNIKEGQRFIIRMEEDEE